MFVFVCMFVIIIIELLQRLNHRGPELRCAAQQNRLPFSKPGTFRSHHQFKGPPTIEKQF